MLLANVDYEIFKFILLAWVLDGRIETLFVHVLLANVDCEVFKFILLAWVLEMVDCFK